MKLLQSIKQSSLNPSSKRLRSILLFALAMLILMGSMSIIHGGKAQSSTDSATSSVREIHLPPQTGRIYIAIWIINNYAFDYVTGRYTLDMIFSFVWNDQNISSIKWHLMNGSPSYSGAFYLISNGSWDDGTSWEFYRATADLGAPINPRDYPFDRIELPIDIEVLGLGTEITLRWLESEVGIAPSYTNPGWENPEFELKILAQNYPYNIIVERAEMVIIQQRRIQSAVSTITPPIIFCIVSALSFLLRMDESGSIGMRIGLTTSMLITSVLLSVNESNNLPPVSELTVWDILIISVIAFIALNTLVTVRGYLEFSGKNRIERLKKINQLGFLFSLVASIAIFLMALLFSHIL